MMEPRIGGGGDVDDLTQDVLLTVANELPQFRHNHAPGAFRFAEGGKLASLLRETGAVQVDERLLQFHIQADLPLKKFWTLRSELSDTLREKAKKLSSEQLAQIEQEVTAAAQPFFPNNQMNYPAAVIVVTGQA